MKYLLIVVVLLSAFVLNAIEPSLNSLKFEESRVNFPNPERGWLDHVYVKEDNSGYVKQFKENYKNSQTLILAKFIIPEFADKFSLDKNALAKIDNFFSLLKPNGMKANFRIYYSDDGGFVNQNIKNITNHLQQLKPFFKKYEDVLFVVEAGCIGPWGEWHSSSLINDKDMRTVVKKELEVIPKSRMIVLRQPKYKRVIFNDKMITENSAFSGSDVARVGFHNDCFLANDTDQGTYNERSRLEELDYIGHETAFTPFGGETCPPGDNAECENTVIEMNILHMNYLHTGWWIPAIDKWEDGGCKEQITLRLGYRFILKQAQISKEVAPGGFLRVKVAVSNAGFGRLIYERPVKIVIFNKLKRYISDFKSDPRWWRSGATVNIERVFHVPANMIEGIYSVAIYMPDNSKNLAKDPRYAVRFANKNVWDKNSGYNVIMRGLKINKKSLGLKTPGNNFSL